MACCSQYNALNCTVVAKWKYAHGYESYFTIKSHFCPAIENKERRHMCPPPPPPTATPSLLPSFPLSPNSLRAAESLKASAISSALFRLPSCWLFQSSQLCRVFWPTCGYPIPRIANSLQIFPK